MHFYSNIIYGVSVRDVGVLRHVHTSKKRDQLGRKIENFIQNSRRKIVTVCSEMYTVLDWHNLVGALTS